MGSVPARRTTGAATAPAASAAASTPSTPPCPAPRAALREIAGCLRAHAEATDTARSTLLAASGHAATPDTTAGAEQRILTRAIQDFHASEQRTRARLWQLGRAAPGGIPLPQAMPRPEPPLWARLLGAPTPGLQTWLDRSGEPTLPDGVCYHGDLYGYDEDGRVVPAYAGDPMSQPLHREMAPVSAILRVLRVGAEVAGGVIDGRKQMKQLIENSHGFRDAHFLPKVRLYYRLGDDTPIDSEKEMFLNLILDVTVSADKVFPWSVKGKKRGKRQPTYAVLNRSGENNRWIVVQFYDGGDRDGQFATAFEPTVSQQNRMRQVQGIDNEDPSCKRH